MNRQQSEEFSMADFVYSQFFPEIVTEGHCVMVNLPKHDGIMELVNNLPAECIYEEEGKHYGRETNPHVTVMYGISPVAEGKAKHIMSHIPKRISATLGKISKFENPDKPFDVLKVEVHSSHLTKIHETLKRTCENDWEYPGYSPHVTLAYVKKGTCNELVGDKRFEGTKFMFEAFMYSNGVRQENHVVSMSDTSASNDVKKKVEELASRFDNFLEVVISVYPDKINLTMIRAKKKSPDGTGTKFMVGLCQIADDAGLPIILQTAEKHHGGGEFKSTTSSERLKKFYGRFGFKYNYSKRNYRPDLGGNMHRLPAGKKISEYNVGTSGGYGGGAMAGGAVAASGWAGTPSSNQTSRRLKDYPASRRYTYMQGNTVIGNSLYDTITKDDLKDPRFTADQIMSGLRYEMKRLEYPDKDVARPVVIKNLEKNPNYYSDLDMYLNSDKL